MKAIYKFEINYGRGSRISGIFVADKDQIAERMNCEIAYGEVMGKHSEVVAELDDTCLKMVSENPADIEVFERLELTTGINPIEYSYKKDGSWVDY
jgi:hypothetical protein